MARGSRPGKLTVAACVAALVGASTLAVSAAGSAGAATSDRCPLSALKNASKPVEVTFWHSMPRANEETLTALTNEFNASQSDVKVTLVNQVTYDDTFTKYIAGLSSGDLPDLVQLQGGDQQQMIDTRTALPAGVCAKAEKYSFSDFVPRVVDYFTVGGTVVGMPFNTSGPVFMYNKAAFERAGLDPEQPPTTLDEVRQYAEQIKSRGAVTGAPMGLKVDPGHFEHWRAMANKLFVNNNNGRKSRATKAVFDDKTGRELFAWMAGMVEDDLAATNPVSGSSQFDNLLGIGNGSHAMTIDTSAALGTITQVLATGQYPDVELGVGPMPGPSGRGGVLVQGAALYIVNRSSPAKQAAAWEFLKFLDRDESQATWAIGTGYIPVVQSAADLQRVQDFWAENPGYKVAYDQLLDGVTSAATAGAVIGPYQEVLDAVADAEDGMFLEGTSPKSALQGAARAATAAIADYNQRVPAG